MRLINSNKVFDPLVIILLAIAGVGVLSVAIGIWIIAHEEPEFTAPDISETVTPEPIVTTEPEELINDSSQEEGTQEEETQEEETQGEETQEGEVEEDTSEIPDTELVIIDKFVSWGYRSYPGSREVDAIIIHSAYDALGDDFYSVDGVIEEFRIYKVSSHYLIDRDGNIYQLVDDNDIAYHAGAGKMPDGRTSINNFSIGIELIYHELESPNEVQYQTLVRLVEHLAEAYRVSSANIVGHEEIDPSRKTDPWNFDWEKFENMME